MKKRVSVSPSAVLVLALVAVTVAAYAKVFTLGFVFDDREYILENPSLTGHISGRQFWWAFTSFFSANWHPLTWISHMFDVVLFGLNPAGHHGVNLLFHIVNTVLVHAFFRKTTGALFRPALIAGLFALHPIHVESVAWISQRKDLLSAFFGLLALLAYRRYAASPGRRRFAIVIGFFILALLSKPMLVTLPFLLLLLDYWPLGRMGRGGAFTGGISALVIEKTPLFLLAAAGSIITLVAQARWGALKPLASFPFKGRMENAIVTSVDYLWKMLWPKSLAVFYPYRGDLIAWWTALGAAGLLAGFTVFVFRHGRRRPYLGVGWLWYLGMLVPVSGLVKMGEHAGADRYTYIPLIGPFLIVSWILGDGGLRGKLRKSGVAAVMAAVLCALAVLTWFQVGHWKNDETLFAHAARVTRGNSLAYFNLGSALGIQGRTAEAKVCFQEALRFNPFYPEAHGGLGLILVKEGDPDAGMLHFQEALRLKPDFPEVRINLGALLAGRGKTAEAESQYREALRRHPDQYIAHMNLANILSDTGRRSEALDHYREALRINPNDAQIHYNLGLTLASLQRYAEAQDEYLSALRLKPDYPEARRNLMTINRSRKAIVQPSFSPLRKRGAGGIFPWSEISPNPSFPKRGEDYRSSDAELLPRKQADGAR